MILKPRFSYFDIAVLGFAVNVFVHGHYFWYLAICVVGGCLSGYLTAKFDKS